MWKSNWLRIVAMIFSSEPNQCSWRKRKKISKTQIRVISQRTGKSDSRQKLLTHWWKLHVGNSVPERKWHRNCWWSWCSSAENSTNIFQMVKYFQDFCPGSNPVHGIIAFMQRVYSCKLISHNRFNVKWKYGKKEIDHIVKSINFLRSHTQSVRECVRVCVCAFGWLSYACMTWIVDECVCVCVEWFVPSLMHICYCCSVEWYIGRMNTA